MKSNATQAMVEVSTLVIPLIVNPLTQLWKVINASLLLSHTFPEYLKLVVIVMSHVLGLVEDERCFSFVSFLKIVELIEPSFAICCYVCTKKFTLENFPCVATFESWANVMTANGWGQYE
jgi:hypothetical protein